MTSRTQPCSEGHRTFRDDCSECVADCAYSFRLTHTNARRIIACDSAGSCGAVVLCVMHGSCHRAEKSVAEKPA